MASTTVSTRLAPKQTAAVEQLLADASAMDGFRPVSDQFWADLMHPGLQQLRGVLIAGDTDQQLDAYAQATSDDSIAWTCEIVVHPRARAGAAALFESTLAAVRDVVAEAGAQSLIWLVQGPTDDHRRAAEHAGFELGRQLHQMRRALPTGLDADLETRPFDPNRDIEAWLAVNARAFAWNPDQGHWTEANLRARMDEPWFDEKGFLIHDRDGRMAGFCWTKIHADHEPPLGEIYVIAVDPDFHGLGLGRRLTLAGLNSLNERGIDIGMLFVDAANTAGIHLYDKLGFTVHRTDAMFEMRINA